MAADLKDYLHFAFTALALKCISMHAIHHKQTCNAGVAEARQFRSFSPSDASNRVTCVAARLFYNLQQFVFLRNTRGMHAMRGNLRPTKDDYSILGPIALLVDEHLAT